MPTGHSSHEDSPLPPLSPRYRPAGHSAHDVLPDSALYVPGPHATHASSSL